MTTTIGNTPTTRAADQGRTRLGLLQLTPPVRQPAERLTTRPALPALIGAPFPSCGGH